MADTLANGTVSAGQVVVAQDDAPTSTLQQQINSVDAAYRASQGADNSSYVNTTGTGTTPTLSLTNSQATSGTEPVFQASQVNQDLSGTINNTAVANPATSAGVGAGSADAAQPSKNSTAQEIDNVFSNAGTIVPQPNILDQYASYTYQASFYLMKPEAFQSMVNSRKFNPAGSQLLFQDGGAAVTGRNPYFTNDYYIDRFEIASTISGKGTGTAHNANSIKMTVTEPNGITLLENLDKAVTEYLGTAPGAANKKKNFQSQLYLLVLKFWGIDENGKIVQGGQSSTTTSPGSPSAPAVVTKYFPVVLNGIKFKIANKLVEYEFDMTAVQYQINTGQLRAVIPYNIELSSTTLKDAFNGAADVTTTSSTTATTTGATTTNTTTSTSTVPPRDEQSSTQPTAPQKADSAPTAKLTVRQGIVAAMNNYQLELVKSEQITIPDTYSVEFVTDAIAQAKIAKVGQADSKDPMPTGGTAKQQKDPDAQPGKDTTTRTLSIMAGAPMVQVIDQLVKNSTYIEDQQLVKVLEKNGIQVPNGKPGNNLAWYKISMQATPKAYDPKRNAPAYNIKYIVHPYKVNDMVSNYFNTPKYNGVHKQYNYWFTGENTQILSYEQTYNNLYTQVLTGGPSNPNSNNQSNVQMTPATRSGQSSQGAIGRANEPAANAADYLYSPGDNVSAQMSIIGDPAWLQQGEITFGVDSKNFNFKGFLDDGTINFDAQQILFEVLFNVPTDYNLNTGLMDPNVPTSANNSNGSAAANAGAQPGALRRSFVFLATEVISEFSRGKFTQTLKGSKINQFDNQASKTGTLARPVAKGTTADTGVRAANSSTGPNGIDSIPTAQPSAAPVDTNGSGQAPASGESVQVNADGTVVQYPPNPNSSAAIATNNSPQTVQPARYPIPAPTSTGDIVATPTGATDGGTNLAPAPAVLPIKSATETFEQYQAKLQNQAGQQVNTTPPQQINKSDA